MDRIIDPSRPPDRLIVEISGCLRPSTACACYRALKALPEETDLMLTHSAEVALAHETRDEGGGRAAARGCGISNQRPRRCDFEWVVPYNRSDCGPLLYAQVSAKSPTASPALAGREPPTSYSRNGAALFWLHQRHPLQTISIRNLLTASELGRSWRPRCRLSTTSPRRWATSLIIRSGVCSTSLGPDTGKEALAAALGQRPDRAVDFARAQ